MLIMLSGCHKIAQKPPQFQAKHIAVTGAGNRLKKEPIFIAEKELLTREMSGKHSATLQEALKR